MPTTIFGSRAFFANWLYASIVCVDICSTNALHLLEKQNVTAKRTSARTVLTSHFSTTIGSSADFIFAHYHRHTSSSMCGGRINPYQFYKNDNLNPNSGRTTPNESFAAAAHNPNELSEPSYRSLTLMRLRRSSVDSCSHTVRVILLLLKLSLRLSSASRLAHNPNWPSQP